MRGDHYNAQEIVFDGSSLGKDLSREGAARIANQLAGVFLDEEGGLIN